MITTEKMQLVLTWLQLSERAQCEKLNRNAFNVLSALSGIYLGMFSKKRSSQSSAKQTLLPRPSQAHRQLLQNDQLPFLARSRFSALPQVRAVDKDNENLTLFIAFLYIIDLFGVFPFVTLPALLVELGFLGIPLVLFVVALEIYTSFLLSKCWTMAESLEPSIVQKRRYPYAAIAELAYGPRISLLVTILLDLSIFSQYIPNLVEAAENLEMAGYRLSDGEFKFSFCYWILIIGVFVCPLMWLGSPKHMRWLAILSVWVVIIIVVLLWFCLFTAMPLGRPFEGITWALPPWLTIVNGYSILAFQFDIHSMLLTLQIDMQQKSQVGWAAFSGIATTCGVAIIGSVIAAYKFGTMIADNVLETLPKSVPLFTLAILMAFQLCFSSVAGSSAMYLQIENQFKIPEAFSLKRVAIRSTVLAFEVFLAEFVPSFEVVMDIVGGTITGPLVFILPPLLYRRISHMDRVHQRVAVEVAYGSIPLDLNQYPMSSVERMPLVVLENKSKNIFRSFCQQTLTFINQFYCDLSMPTFVLIFGIVATICSTYLNFFKLSELFLNNSQCFGSLSKGI